MARKSSFTINLEYGALRFFCALVNAIPYRVACALATAIAWIAFNVLRFKRGRTLGRIGSVFPTMSPAERRRIAFRSLANVLKTGVEMMRASRLDRAWIDRYVAGASEAHAKLKAVVDRGRGAVIMVPHAGNWYMAAWTMAKYSLPLCAIAAKQRNPKLDAWMKRQYGDIEVVDRGSARTLVEIKEKILAGRAFAILPDLRVPQPDVEVDFLGGKANVSHAGAMFAVKTGAPVVVGMMRREKGRHVVDYLAEIESAGRTAEDLTREVMAILDANIRLHPGDWFWYNKRWILQPVKQKGKSK